MPINSYYCALNADKSLSISQKFELNQGENLTTRILFVIPEQYSQYDFNVEFLCPHNRAYQTPKLTSITDQTYSNVLYYDVENVLTYERGLVLLQLIARSKTDYAVIFKSTRSNLSSFYVQPSLNYVVETYQKKDFFARASADLDVLTNLTDNLETIKNQTVVATTNATNATNTLLQKASNGEFKGEKGDANVLSIGTITSAVTPNATITGTSPNQILNLTLPKGDKGDKGDKGEKGSVWLYGTILSGQTQIISSDTTLLSNAKIDDYYVNAVSGDYYVCTAITTTTTTWDYCANIKGPSGDTTLSVSSVIQGFANGNVLFNNNGHLNSKAVDTIVSNTNNLVTSGAVNTAISSAVSSIYRYKGSVTNYSDLPTQNNCTGDTYNVTNSYNNYPSGTNFAFNGQTWDGLGGAIDLTNFVDMTNSQTINGEKTFSQKIVGNIDTANDINVGHILNVNKGGTGKNSLPVGQVLVGDGVNAVATLSIDTTLTNESQNLITSGSVKTAVDSKQDKNLYFFDTVIPISNANTTVGFVADTTYADFPFRATVMLNGVTANNIPNVCFSLLDATNGKFAPVCESFDGGIYLYSKESNSTEVNVKSIIIDKGGI